MKAIDLWMLFSFVITFINLLAFCVIVYLEKIPPKVILHRSCLKKELLNSDMHQ